jgi:competence protein ComEC
MDWWLLSFFIGAILSLYLPIIPEIFILLLFISLAIALFFNKKTRSASGLFFGLAWVLFNGFQYDNTWLVNKLDIDLVSKKIHQVEGKIVSIPAVDKGNYRFNFMLVKLNDQDMLKPFVIRLRWKFNPKDSSVVPVQGHTYHLTVKVKPAHGYANEGGFSYQTWLREKNIVATGYVKSSTENRLVSSNTGLRQALYSQYVMNLPEHPLSPLLLALSFAQRNKISAGTWQVLQATGTQHLIAISGLHLGLVASGSFMFFLFATRILPLHQLLPRKVWQPLLAFNLRYLVLILSLLTTLFYGYLADFSIPTTRALTMLILYWLTRLLGIKLTLKRWFLLTLCTLVLIAPFSLLSTSFWLSVYAVMIIFLTLWRFSYVLNDGVKFWRIAKSLLIIQLSLTFFLLPLTSFFYHQVSTVSLVANLLAVPMMSFIIIPLSLLSLILLLFNENLAHWVMQLALDILQWLWQYLLFLTNQSHSLLSLSLVQSQVIAAVVAVIAFRYFISSSFFKFSMVDDKIYLWLRNTRALLVIIALSSLLTFSNSTNTHENKDTLIHSNRQIDWQVNILDVGQGLAVVIQQGEHAILYDTGGAYPSGFNMTEAVILPYLHYHSINQLDKVIISHSDNDHAGGLTILRKKIVINEVIVNDVTIRESDDDFCLSGQSFKWRGLYFDQLWPEKKQGENNDDSCVIRISDGLHSILLTGDISKKVEKLLVNKAKNNTLTLDSDVLIAPHHGSKSSSSIEFIKQVAPDAVVFSAGFLNRWNMPNKLVKQRFINNNIMIHSTNEHGMIRVDMHDKKVNILQYRRDLSPYWFVNSKRKFN